MFRFYFFFLDWSHLFLNFIVQSINARANPISCPARSDSYHLCFIISSLCARNSLYKEVSSKFITLIFILNMYK